MCLAYAVHRFPTLTNYSVEEKRKARHRGVAHPAESKGVSNVVGGSLGSHLLAGWFFGGTLLSARVQLTDWVID